MVSFILNLLKPTFVSILMMLLKRKWTCIISINHRCTNGLPFNQGVLDQVPATDADRREWLGKTRKKGSDATPYREKLIELYGKEKGSAIKYCEAFQDSGYGTSLTKENMKYYFPFLDTK